MSRFWSAFANTCARTLRTLTSDADADTAPPELGGLAGRVACLADARPIEDLCGLFDAAGCSVTAVERHDEALLETILQVQTRLRALRFLDLPLLRRFDLRRGVELAGRAAEVVRGGGAGYVLVVARKEGVRIG